MAQVQLQGEELCTWNHGKASFTSLLDCSVEASGDIRLGSKGRIQESAANYFGGTFVSKTCDLKKKEIWQVHKIQSNVFIFLTSF